VSLGRLEARGLANDRNDGNAAAVVTVVLEPDLAIELRVQGVILPETDIETGFESPPLLSHQDRSTRDDVPVVPLDTEPLRVAVPAVS
jgi:hypothetical protein